MPRKKEYEIEVLFSTPIYVKVEAKDVDEAMEYAEQDATEIFQDQLDGGLLGVSDFDCEAQTPQV